MERVSSGIDELDAAVGGLMPGDNVVWIGGDEPLHHELQRQLLSTDSNAPARVFVTTDEDPAHVRRRLGNIEVLDGGAFVGGHLPGKARGVGGEDRHESTPGRGSGHAGPVRAGS